MEMHQVRYFLAVARFVGGDVKTFFDGHVGRVRVHGDEVLGEVGRRPAPGTRVHVIAL